MNIYRGWVGENATRTLRSAVFAASPRECGSRSGTRISIALAEADPIGKFVGVSISEPLLQCGVLASLFGYMLFIQPWMALVAFGALAPQILYIPAMQNAINRRATERILALREVSASLSRGLRGLDGPRRQQDRADRVFHLNMGVYKIKYAMDFLMNGSVHFSMAGILALGGYFVSKGKIDAGSVVACMAGLSKISDPWGDLVDWFRDLRVTQARYTLIRNAGLRAAAGRSNVSYLSANRFHPSPVDRVVQRTDRECRGLDGRRTNALSSVHIPDRAARRRGHRRG
jgi:ABC-type multidrug transport system fused ATPase/permease subunit